MKLKVGQTLYACGYKTREISFGYDLIIGLKIMKVKILKLTNKFIVLDGQRISKNRIGRSIFTTEKELVNFMIKENQRRLDEKSDAKRKQDFDIEHIEAITKDLKKWQKYAKESEEAKR